jgi:hypothetical protein
MVGLLDIYRRARQSYDPDTNVNGSTAQLISPDIAHPSA